MNDQANDASTEEQNEEQTAAQIGADIQSNKQRRGEVQARLAAAQRERVQRESDLGQAVASGNAAEETEARTRMRELAEEIEACASGLRALEAAQPSLIERLDAAQVSEAKAELETLIVEWGGALDEADMEVRKFHSDVMAPRWRSIGEIQERITRLERVANIPGASSALGYAHRHSRCAGRPVGLMIALEQMAAGKTFSWTWGQTGPASTEVKTRETAVSSRFGENGTDSRQNLAGRLNMVSKPE